MRFGPDAYKIDANECWIWLGYADRNGYPRTYDPAKRSVVWAHRYSYEQHKGPIPERHEIDHMCVVPLCVNPDHLQALTRLEHARVTFQRAGKDDLHLAAAQLRRRGLTYKEIADALGYTTAGSGFSAIRSAVEKGLIDGSEVPPAPRLNREERDEIRVLYTLGVPQTAIARFYGVDSSQVSRICNGKTSGHGNMEVAS